MQISNPALQILENHFEFIKFFFKERISNPIIGDSEFETISKNIFKQMNATLKLKVTEREFIYFCKLNQSRLLDLSQNV